MQVAVSLGLRHQARSDSPKAATKATASVPTATATYVTRLQKRKSASDMADLISVNQVMDVRAVCFEPLRVPVAQFPLATAASLLWLREPHTGGQNSRRAVELWRA
jgi:hypothetical protein